tara:strand:- start:521 stop:766 length:246 start_codon:yes stop_codon:yes gene_type:complete
LLVGDYDLKSDEWKKAKRILNIIDDTLPTVTSFLADRILKTEKSGSAVKWLTGGKAFKRFMTAGFNKRGLAAEVEVKRGAS